MAKTFHRMELKEVVISGYKSIAAGSPVHLNLSNINVLLGANGAGKSNILSFFNMVGAMMHGGLRYHVAKAGSVSGFLHYGVHRTPVISASLTIEDDGKVYYYKFNLVYAQTRLAISSEELSWKDKSGSDIFQENLDLNYSESALLNSNSEACAAVRSFLSDCKTYQFNDTTVTGPLRQPSPLDTASYLYSDGGNIASFLLFLRNNYLHSYNRIVEYVRLSVPQFHDFYLEENNGYVSLKWKSTLSDEYVFSPHQLSDGSLRFIALATLLLQPKETIPGIIMIDEPELGLHPYAIDRFVEMMKDASLRTQIISSTQSPALIDRVDIDDIIVVDLDETTESTVARHLDMEDLSEWLADYSASELWNKNVFGGRPL